MKARMKLKNTARACIVGFASALSSLVASAVQVEPDSNSTSTIQGDRMIVTYKQSGTLRVTEGGVMRVLLVGGGGGGGAVAIAGTDSFEGAGGGAGGVVYLSELAIEPGEYQIGIGSGGEVNNSAQACANGGNTTAFGLTAYGGGYGAKGCHFNNPGNGGCGGGATCNWDEMSAGGGIGGGGATHAADENIGFAGGAGMHVYFAAGGGGAGGPGEDGNVGSGGIGYLCDISGKEEYYAGGGAAHPAPGTAGGKGGLGGGGDPGQPGTDGLGGGGGSGAHGGSGIVIISFEVSSSYMSDDFDVSGGTCKLLDDATVLTFSESGTLRVTGSGMAEMLMVGGGGGGGATVSINNDMYRGGGGGAGGLVHVEKLFLVEGEYAITIGAGGAVNEGRDFDKSMGGDTLALGYTAKGGGYGEQGYHFNAAAGGGSGGGGSGNWDNWTVAGKGAIYGEEYGNIGHDGGSSSSPYAPGGGGGAGGPGGSEKGGDGLALSITGDEVVYAKGGYSGIVRDGFGDGGNPNERGGSGVVIFRIAKVPQSAEVFEDAVGGVTKDVSRNGLRYRTHTYTENGTFTMAQPGLVEVLLVGGGGGGGEFAIAGSDSYEGAGGGAGGVVHRKRLLLPAGTYDIIVGKGGSVNKTASAEISNGGNTTAFGLTAYGGGYGAKGCHFNNPGNGGCGGGATCNWDEMYAGGGIRGGGATHAADQNIGFAGGAGMHVYFAAGGGGAGGPGEDGNVGSGGIGYLCDISGKEEYYAGGGAANHAPGTAGGKGGLGGGGNPGQPGTDGLGGGGGSGAPGGSGIVIVTHQVNRRGCAVILK